MAFEQQFYMILKSCWQRWKPDCVVWWRWKTVNGERKDKASSVLVLLLKSLTGLRWAIAWQTASDLVQYGNHPKLQPLISISRGNSTVDPVEGDSWLSSSITADTILYRLSHIYIICWHQKQYVLLCIFLLRMYRMQIKVTVVCI